MLTPLSNLSTLLARRHFVFVMFSLAVSLSACSSSTSWTEVVKTFDGTTVEVYREEQRWSFAMSSLPGSGGLEKQLLSVTLPKQGMVVWEDSHQSLSTPIGFDVVAGVPWLVISNDEPCEINPTNEPLRVFRYENKTWTQVPLGDAPKLLNENLLHYSYAESKGYLGKTTSFPEYSPKHGGCLSPIERLHYSDNCGKTLDDLADAALTNGRNCSLKSGPKDPEFQTKWNTYQQAEAKEVEARVTNRDALAPMLQFNKRGDRRTSISGSIHFDFTFGCKEDVLRHIVEYGDSNATTNPIEFLLAGPERTTFFAELPYRPGTLLCDQQGFKLLRLDSSPQNNKFRFAHAIVFDRSGNLVGKWAVKLPEQQLEPAFYDTDNQRAFLCGFDVLETELRIWIGKSKFIGEACRIEGKGQGLQIIELRAER